MTNLNVINKGGMPWLLNLLLNPNYGDNTFTKLPNQVRQNSFNPSLLYRKVLSTTYNNRAITTIFIYGIRYKLVIIVYGIIDYTFIDIVKRFVLAV